MPMPKRLAFHFSRDHSSAEGHSLLSFCIQIVYRTNNDVVRRNNEDCNANLTITRASYLSFDLSPVERYIKLQLLSPKIPNHSRLDRMA